jgi:putative ABC transport system permease protein
LPAIHSARGSVSSVIAELSRGSTSARRRTRLRDILVVGQIATTLLLLVGATVLMRSFLAVRQVSPGFAATGVLSAHLAVPRSKYPRPVDVATLYSRILDRVQALPGVVAAGMVNRLPLGGGNQTGGVVVDGVEPGRVPSVETRTVTPDYFRALGIPIQDGRTFGASDTEGAAKVAIIDEALARALWPGQSAIGRRIRESTDPPDAPWNTIVGVVGHIRHSTLEEDSRPQVYWDYRQRGQDRMALVVKTRGQPAALMKSIATAVRSVDPEQPLYDVRTLDDVVDRSLGQRRFQMLVLGGFAIVALLLASVGTYGVIAYGVGQRLREFGVRIALGATHRDVLGLVLARGGALFGAGALIGVVLAGATVRVLATLVYGVGPHDIVSFVAATMVLFLVSIAACYVPARRAARVDPSVALRSE